MNLMVYTRDDRDYSEGVKYGCVRRATPEQEEQIREREVMLARQLRIDSARQTIKAMNENQESIGAELIALNTALKSLEEYRIFGPP